MVNVPQAATVGTPEISFSHEIYNYSDAAFIVDFSQQRNGADGALAETYGDIVFTPNIDLLYSLTGNYWIAQNSSGAEVEFKVSLLDLTSSPHTNLFNNIQSLSGNVSTTVGAVGSSVLTGSQMGLLNAGSQYEFQYTARTMTDSATVDNGATGSGEISLAFTPAQSTPLPGILPVGMTLFFGLTIAHKYRRTAPRP